MNDSSLNSAVVARVLQVTRQSWMQPLAPPLTAGTLPVRKLSSHALASQRLAMRSRKRWGLQPVPGSMSALQA